MARVIIGHCILFLLSTCVINQVEASFRLGEKGPRISGFFEFAFGGKLESDITKLDDFNMLEQRLQLETSFYPKFSTLLKKWGTGINFKGDVLIDEYYGGKTEFELRELNAIFSPLSWMDCKFGRQVFTWGTGDYMFVNDLFPKDYVSFYIGRDDEYLKKPSDGMKFSLYSKKVNFDMVIIPVFEPNTIFTGDRLSFFDSFQGGIAGRNSERYLAEPAQQFNNTEYATRLYRNFGSYEVALYTFRGFYKMPRGYLDEARKILFYPRLDAYGMSTRGPALGGIMNFEAGYYHSQQDSQGNNRLIENSIAKCLVGYDKDLGNDFRAGLQYLYEQILEYSNYRDALLSQDFRWDEHRHVASLRLTKLFKNQTVRVNLFTFFSPSDLDGYIRPSIDYDVSDDFKVTLGANLVWGEDDHAEFGQMQNNDNIYLRARYSF
ncbi:hypothetical protein ACFL1E_03100 [Candidatus Omnitrophota bacterium]